MATVTNLNKSEGTFNTQVIADVADVTSLVSPETPFRFNYNDGGGIDIDFDSPGVDGLPRSPATNDVIILEESSTQRNLLMTAAEYAATGAA